jgi:hypothetical protein
MLAGCGSQFSTNSSPGSSRGAENTSLQVRALRAIPRRVVSSVLSFLFRLSIARLGLLLVSGDKRDPEILALRHQVLVPQRLQGSLGEQLLEPDDVCMAMLAVVSETTRHRLHRIGMQVSAGPARVY